MSETHLGQKLGKKVNGERKSGDEAEEALAGKEGKSTK